MQVAEHLAGGGCPLCAVRSRAERRFLDAAIAEAVTDVGARRRLDASGGYCGRHAAMLPGRERDRRGGTLGSAVLLGSVLRSRLETLDAIASDGGRRLGDRVEAARRPPQCPVCQDVRGSVGAATTVIGSRLGDPAWAAALGGAQLCVADLLALWEAAARSDRKALEAWRPIGGAQSARLRAALATAEAYVAHSGHDRQAELSDEERRAADVLAGLLGGDDQPDR
jgi:hypothetical protein